MNPQYPCKIFKNEIKDIDPSVCCDLCNMWSNIECVNISSKTYEKLQDDVASAWYCPICVRSLPFSELRTKELKIFLSSDTIEHTQKPQKTPKRLNKQTRELIKKFFQNSQLNDSIENTVSCDYYDLNDFNKVIVTKQDLAVLHLNISLLSSHINELKLLLSSSNLNFDIICITESRITKSNLPTSNIHIPGYNIEQTPTESSAGSTLIYISQKISYKNRPDLQIYHPKQLESIFIEILLPDKSNFIVGTVYKHPPMKSYSFNTSFSQLLQKMKIENKKTIITGDFNLNLLNHAKTLLLPYLITFHNLRSLKIF